MLRSALATVTAAALIAISGCGSSSDLPTASGEFGKLPQLRLPSATPTGYSATLARTGKGPAIKAGDIVQTHFLAKNWRGGTVLAETFTTGKPTLIPVGAGQTLPGWEKGLLGKPVGSRIVIVTPPAEGLGPQGNPQLKVAGTDTIVTVMDVLNAFNGTSSADGTPVTPAAGLPVVTASAGTAPKVTFPGGYTPGPLLVVQQLLKGSGQTVAKGDTMLAQYVGVLARSGKVFDSSWSRKQPATFEIGTGKVVAGWDEGLVGQPVGSRVLLVLPPNKGYGKDGNAQAGITGTDTLVFVVDILAVV